MPVDSAVACIIARELLEGTMFITSHIGAVQCNPAFNSSEKRSYVLSMIVGIVGGLLSGAAISIAVGFSVAQSIDSLEEASNGVEAGEAASKAIAAFFVVNLALKLPHWFGITAYKNEDSKTATSPAIFPSEEAKDPEAGTLVAVDKEAEVISPDESDLPSPFSMALSLYWNIMREATEGGILTAFVVLLSSESMDDLGESVGLGIGAAAILAVIMGFGAKYISARGFGVAATVIAQMLAVGLITGATRSFEEVYAHEHDDRRSAIVYEIEDTENGDILTSFEFVGISDNLTVLVLCIWILSAVILALMQIWHNYFGYPLFLRTMKCGGHH